MLFFKVCHQNQTNQISKTRLRFGGKTVFFNKKATQWLEVLLNSYLNFTAYVNKKMKKTKSS